MKANCTQTFLLRSIFFVLSFISSLAAFCQPDYDFKNSVLVSGTDKQIGAVYLFKDVKSGVDATVTIKNITGGVTLNNIDGGSGYKEALQPVIDIAPLSTGYVEFEVNFLFAGTNTPMIQTEVPATPIDVDGQNYGDGIVKEFDVLQLTNGYINFDMLGGELAMNITGPWVTGSNVVGIDYPGVDTTPRQVMFTVVNAGISKFTFRTGATSLSLSSRQRLRSVYFKKFAYANAFLSTPSLVSFSGITKDKKVALQWNISSGSSLKEVVVERSFDLRSFSSIADIAIVTKNSVAANYNFTDNAALQGTVYYRLKMINSNEEVQYSNVLVFHTDGNTKQAFKMYPSVIADNATVNISTSKNEQASLQVVDLNGRSVYQKNISLQEGNNNIAVSGFSRLPQGTYVAVVNSNGELHAQKIMIK
jgi:Secretion system C-terminal sorting domain